MVSKENSSLDLIIVLGATATGKTKLAVKLADKLDGEIISADSRQVYRKLDIGTGKDYKDYILNGKKIPYHLIDIIGPNESYSVYNFQNDFKIAFEKIISSNKKPILCGGTGLYIESVLLNYPLTDCPPNYKLRKELDNISIEELRKLAGRTFYKYANPSEIQNKRRIIRFIEKLQANVQSDKQVIKITSSIVLGIDYSREIIRNRITKRLLNRLENGLIKEVQDLIRDGITNSKLESLGLEYKYISLYLQKKLNEEELEKKLETAIHRFAKRQMSWYKRMEKRGVKIHWIKNGNFQTALEIITKK